MGEERARIARDLHRPRHPWNPRRRAGGHARRRRCARIPQLHIEGPVDSAISPDVADDLLAVLREALSNAARHASATAVEVLLTVTKEVILEVRETAAGVTTRRRLCRRG
jgi:signal transduction histidine kinase